MNKKPVKFAGLSYLLLRPRAGKMQCKYNRATKLAVLAPGILEKLDGFIDTINFTERSQCALAIKLAMLTGMRVGNEESAEGYVTKVHPMMQKKGVEPEFRQTYGVTTLLKKHVTVKNGKAIFSFVGKKGVAQKVIVSDHCFVWQIKQQLKMEGEKFLSVDDYDVRKFVKRSVGRGFKVKDFRTMYANAVATEEVLSMKNKPGCANKRELKAEQKGICERVSQMLGNTAAIAKRAYIDPMLLDAHQLFRYGKP